MNIIQEQKLRDYQSYFMSDPRILNNGVWESDTTFDAKREEARLVIKQLINQFLNKQIQLQDFKKSSEELCRLYPYWGFKGMSGQMQLNQYINNVSRADKEQILQTSIALPESNDDAKNKLNQLAAVLQTEKEQAENKQAIPRVAQLSMLSYFWEIQDPTTWPAYYGSTKKVMSELDLELTASDPGTIYLAYKAHLDKICELFKSFGQVFGVHPYWTAEHVLWRQYVNNQETNSGVPTPSTDIKIKTRNTTLSRESIWIPPIVSDLVELAQNKETFWTKRNGVKPEKAFETKLRYVFTMLGYNTTELGQGTGREPDGIARTFNTASDYALIYDAKARETKFSFGTSDRAIKEYIEKYKKVLEHERIYHCNFVIISSNFDESSNSLSIAHEIYKQTRIHVTLVKAEDLLLILEAKLQNIEIDVTLLEDLFLNTGILTREMIVEKLGI